MDELKDFTDLKISHKQKKALLKKLKRKAKRQEVAKQRDERIQIELVKRRESPSYQAQLAQEEYKSQLEILQIEAESRRQHELWLWSEERWAEQQKLKKEQEERERLQKIEIEKRIKEEWEERQKKEQEEEEEKRKKKEKQAALLQQAREAENKDGGDWHNPLAPPGKERETCPFFAKVGVCRFGERCSRGHPHPDSSTVLMFAGMFSHFRLDQGLCEEYDTDIALEYEDSELYQNFHDFYIDVLPEFKSCGEVVQFKVCCNYQSHLRGNVYVQFAREEDAQKGFSKFNARWYGGKQLSCEFVSIPSWRSAICGLFGQGRCPKGKECNFLHVFTNPNKEFWQADRGFQTPAHHQSWRNDRFSDRNNRYRRPRSRSLERRRRRSRSSSRSKYSRNRYSRSRSKDRYYRKSKYKRSKYSRSKSKSKSRSYSRSRSRSKDRKHRRNYKSRSQSRSRSSSYSRSRSRSRDRYKDTRFSRKSRRHSPSSDKDENRQDNGIDNAGSSAKFKDRHSRSRSRERSRSYNRERKHQNKHKKHKKQRER